ncbi:hypothetical protein ACQP2E_37250 [Actinoplanes sp. CA-015351]|uniref:hypothetical protein n=1 Tax=Actinoplanes sp. CA-015351 TaxID=3239897 RepID=UPI003D98744C
MLLATMTAGAIGAPAMAASTGAASVSSTTVTYQAGLRKINAVTLTRSGRTVTIDDRVTIKAGKGCKRVKGRVGADGTHGEPGEGDVIVGPISQIFGSPSADVLHATATHHAGYIHGGAGDDEFSGDGEVDLYGDDGADRLTDGNLLFGSGSSDSVPLKAGKGCKPGKSDKTKVRCTTKRTPTQITAHLGDKNDVLANKTKINFLGYAGTGDDKLYGGTGTDPQP